MLLNDPRDIRFSQAELPDSWADLMLLQHGECRYYGLPLILIRKCSLLKKSSTPALLKHPF